MTQQPGASEKQIRKKATLHRDAAQRHREQADAASLPAQRAKHIASAERLEAMAEELERGLTSDHPVHRQQMFR